MVQCMESWFLADREALNTYFSQGFRDNGLPATERLLEGIPKEESLDSLKTATRDCKPKGQYHKGRHSFPLLGEIDPQKVVEKSPWAKRFIKQLKAKMNA